MYIYRLAKATPEYATNFHRQLFYSRQTARYANFQKLHWSCQYRETLKTRRPASTISSATAINASKPIPAQYRELHERLILLGSKAETYINVSQLQLVLRGLESDDAIIRIASKFPPLALLMPYADTFFTQCLASMALPESDALCERYWQIL